MAKKRMRMREWLVDNLDRGSFCGTLDWIKGEGDRRLFRIKWLHASTVNYTTEDSNLFEEWCKHTGKLKEIGDSAKRWKANFRCALNSLPDVVQVKDMTVKKGKNAYRVFQILNEKLPEKVAKKKQSNQKFLIKKQKKRRASTRCDPQDNGSSKRGPVTLRIKRASSSDRSVETPTDDSLPESVDCNGNKVDSVLVSAEPPTDCYSELPLTVADINIDDDCGHDDDDQERLPTGTISDAGGSMRHIIDRRFAREQERSADFNHDSTSTLTSSIGDSSEDLLNDVNDIVSSDWPHGNRSQMVTRQFNNTLGESCGYYPMHQDSKNVVVRSNLPMGDSLGMLSCQKEDLSMMD